MAAKPQHDLNARYHMLVTTSPENPLHASTMSYDSLTLDQCEEVLHNFRNSHITVVDVKIVELDHEYTVITPGGYNEGSFDDINKALTYVSKKNVKVKDGRFYTVKWTAI